MRIASITMVGQWPHGINLHLRNLCWALGGEDRIYLIARPETLASAELHDDPRIRCIPYDAPVRNESGILEFWDAFPALIDEHRIAPEWFLLMEQDIWFTARVELPDDPRRLRGFLPADHYHNVMAGERQLHARVWEGAQLLPRSLIDEARAFGIGFSAVKHTFVDRDRARYELEAGGPIHISDFGKADTLDELGLYCALVARTTLEHRPNAVHLRGPEVLHRRFPHLYHGATRAELDAVQAQVAYLDVLLAVATYYVTGCWSEIGHLDWSELRPQSAAALRRATAAGADWMPAQALERLRYVTRLAEKAGDVN